MDLNSLNTFRTLGEINTAIEKSTSLDSALKAGLKIIRDNLDAQMAVIWYYDKVGDRRLHPAFWSAPFPTYCYGVWSCDLPMEC